MKSAKLRERLHELINTVSDEKLAVVYEAVDSAVKPAANWWEDENIIREFDDRVKSWLTGEGQGFSMEDVDREIAKRKQG